MNQLPAWQLQVHEPERTLFWEWQSEGDDQLAALRGDFKLVVTRGGKPEFYNLVTDPEERRDVAANHPELTRQLNEELKAWLGTEVVRPVERPERR